MADCDFYYPFDSVNSDRRVTAGTERRFWAAMFTDGVIGADAFAANATGTGTYSIGAGIGIVAGTIGGNVNAKTVTASPAIGGKKYIVLRANTTSSVRKVTLEVVDSPATDTTLDQIEAGGYRDSILYVVTNNAGTLSILDSRSYATSFDNAIFENEFGVLLDSIRDGATTEMNALIETFQAAIDAANVDNAGTYGAAGRQGFINPTFEVNQRGADRYSLTSGTTYTFDRWLARIGGTATAAPVVFSRQQDGQRMALVVESKQFASGSTSGAACFAQNIEGGVTRFCAGQKKFTVSFDAKASVSGAKLAVEPVQIPTTGGTGTAITAQTVELTTAWKRFSLTFTGTAAPTTAEIKDVLKVAFFFAWRGYSDRFGADNNRACVYQFANMQINEGESALSCYVRDYAEELERCQRYFVKLGFTSLSCGATLATTNQVMTCPLPLARRMYKQPTVTTTDRANVSGLASVQVAAGGWRNGLPCEISSSTIDAPVLIVTNTDSASVARVCFNSVALDAEIFD